MKVGHLVGGVTKRLPAAPLAVGAALGTTFALGSVLIGRHAMGQQVRSTHSRGPDRPPSPPTTYFLPLTNLPNCDAAIVAVDQGLVAMNDQLFGFDPDKVWPSSPAVQPLLVELVPTLVGGRDGVATATDTAVSSFDSGLKGVLDDYDKLLSAYPGDQMLGRVKALLAKDRGKLETVPKDLTVKITDELGKAQRGQQTAYNGLREANAASRYKIAESNSGLNPFVWTNRIDQSALSTAADSLAAWTRTAGEVRSVLGKLAEGWGGDATPTPGFTGGGFPAPSPQPLPDPKPVPKPGPEIIDPGPRPGSVQRVPDGGDRGNGGRDGDRGRDRDRDGDRGRLPWQPQNPLQPGPGMTNPFQSGPGGTNPLQPGPGGTNPFQSGLGGSPLGAGGSPLDDRGLLGGGGRGRGEDELARLLDEKLRGKGDPKVAGLSGDGEGEKKKGEEGLKPGVRTVGGGGEGGKSEGRDDGKGDGAKPEGKSDSKSGVAPAGGEQSRTVRVDNREVTFADARTAKMVAALQPVDGSAPPSLEKAAADAGFKVGPAGQELGVRVDSPQSLRAGDVVVGADHQGVYIGEQKVLCDTGEVRPIGEVARFDNAGPNQGLFRLDGDATEGAGQNVPVADQQHNSGGQQQSGAQAAGAQGEQQRGGDSDGRAPAAHPVAGHLPNPQGGGQPAPGGAGTAPAEGDRHPANGGLPVGPGGRPVPPPTGVSKNNIPTGD